MVGKVTRIDPANRVTPRKKRPTKEDFQRKFDPNRPPDGAA